MLTLRLYSKTVASKTGLLTSSAGVVPAPNLTILMDTAWTMALGFKVRGELTMVGLTEGEPVFWMFSVVSAPPVFGRGAGALTSAWSLRSFMLRTRSGCWVTDTRATSFGLFVGSEWSPDEQRPLDLTQRLALLCVHLVCERMAGCV